jgi:hypothetical protein
VVLFINPGQVNSAVRDSLTPEDMEESVTILHYTAVKGRTHTYASKISFLGFMALQYKEKILGCRNSMFHKRNFLVPVKFKTVLTFFPTGTPYDTVLFGGPVKTGYQYLVT